MFTKKELSKEQVLLQISGPLDGESVVAFKEYLEELVSLSHRTVTFDLSEVQAINSSSIGKILLFRKKLIDQKRKLEIRGCSDELYNIFKTIMFDRIIDIKKERLTTL